MAWEPLPELPSVFEPKVQAALAKWYYDFQLALQQRLAGLDDNIDDLTLAASESNEETMASTPKTLAQSAPASNRLTTMYVAPLRKRVINGRITIANRSKKASTFRVAVAVGGEADDPKQYLMNNTAIDPGESKGADLNLVLNVGDAVRVWAANGQMSFNLQGTEVDVE